jgi:DNA-binding transcriptional ArsR family regulator
VDVSAGPPATGRATTARQALLYDGINESTATHHFKILREAGLTERVVVDGHTHQRLRIDELDDAMPGLLNPVVATANRETGST